MVLFIFFFFTFAEKEKNNRNFLSKFFVIKRAIYSACAHAHTTTTVAETVREFSKVVVFNHKIYSQIMIKHYTYFL